MFLSMTIHIIVAMYLYSDSDSMVFSHDSNNYLDHDYAQKEDLNF
jgi:hypothetical protein